MLCRIYYQYHLAQGFISGAASYKNSNYIWPLTHEQLVDIEKHLAEQEQLSGGVMLFLNIVPLSGGDMSDPAAELFGSVH